MARRGMVVAIDGPSGSGKSTVARGVAAATGWRYLDSGAMYRALTWLALRDHVAAGDDARLTAMAGSLALELGSAPTSPWVKVEGIDVTTAIRSGAVTRAVSAVSAIPGVRHALVTRQQAVIRDGDIVVEGRDIGTTVAPDAQVKIFLTADPDVRARRRTVQEAGGDVPGVQAELARRDSADSSRATSPLAQAPDARVVDSSTLAVDEVVALVLAMVDDVRLQR